MSVEELYIDNEPSSGEWTSDHDSGSSTTVRSADATWLDRGAYGLRTTIVGAGTSYKKKTALATLDAEEELYIGFWLRINTLPSARTEIQFVYGSNTKLDLWLYETGVIKMYFLHDGGGALTGGFTARENSWSVSVTPLTRASRRRIRWGGIGIFAAGSRKRPRLTGDM